ncbi:glutathione S-transferase family protein [Phenylobacterium sp.]|uniref:glutathione S-transferase family protein n=1 Tax=Phenylobacterium sp. TaxID=1871053 RepID=UPI0035B00E7F
MPDLVFYTNPMSRGRIIRWMLEEVGQPYETVLVDWANKDPAFLAVNPMGKVPTIVHGDTVVTECGAVCAYLADAFPQAGLAPPPGDRARGPYYRWLFFAAGPIEQAVGTKALGLEPTPDQEAFLGFGSFARVLDTLEGYLKDREFVAGDRFSAADLYLASHLDWGMQFGTLEKRPVFEAYAKRHTSRPAAKRADEIDNALMPQAEKQPEPVG